MRVTSFTLLAASFAVGYVLLFLFRCLCRSVLLCIDSLGCCSGLVLGRPARLHSRSSLLQISNPHKHQWASTNKQPANRSYAKLHSIAVCVTGRTLTNPGGTPFSPSMTYYEKYEVLVPATECACGYYKNRKTGTQQWDRCPDCTFVSYCEPCTHEELVLIALVSRMLMQELATLVHGTLEVMRWTTTAANTVVPRALRPTKHRYETRWTSQDLSLL